MKHKHAELIKAWADGAEIQHRYLRKKWEDTRNPGWDCDFEYRIKPVPRPQWQQDLIDAAKAGKIVEFGRGTWIKSDLNTRLDEYDFKTHIKKEYRICPEKVTRYLWAYKGTVLNHFASETEVRLNGFQDEYKRLDWSATEFEE